MEQQIWLLKVGEYADESVLGVVVGTEHDAEMKAAVLTRQRLITGEPSDMVLVNVEKAEVL